jgi:hypothetical protein
VGAKLSAFDGMRKKKSIYRCSPYAQNFASKSRGEMILVSPIATKSATMDFGKTKVECRSLLEYVRIPAE